MKKLAASVLLLLSISVPVAAQSPDETAVARAVDSLSKAMIAADKAALESLTAEELSYGHSSPKVDTPSFAPTSRRTSSPRASRATSSSRC
jgi:hypothetical protein